METAIETLVRISLLAPWAVLLWLRVGLPPGIRVLGCALIFLIGWLFSVLHSTTIALGVLCGASLVPVFAAFTEAHFLDRWGKKGNEEVWWACSGLNLALFLWFLGSFAGAQLLPWLICSIYVGTAMAIAYYRMSHEAKEIDGFSEDELDEYVRDASGAYTTFLEERKTLGRREREKAEREKREEEDRIAREEAAALEKRLQAEAKVRRQQAWDERLNLERSRGESVLRAPTSESRVSIEERLIAFVYQRVGISSGIQLSRIAADTGLNEAVLLNLSEGLEARRQTELITRFNPSYDIDDACWADYLMIRVTQSGADRLERVLPRSSELKGQIGLPAGPTLRVLYVTSNPMMNVRTEREVKSVKSALRRSEARDRVDIVHLGAASSRDLIEQLNDIKPDILHIAAHSEGGELIFESVDNAAIAIGLSYGDLARILGALATPPRVLVLNACSTFSGVRELSRAVEVVIATLFPINDDGAAVFAAHLYYALASGQPLNYALEQASAGVDLSKLDGGWKWRPFVRDGIRVEEYEL